MPRLRTQVSACFRNGIFLAALSGVLAIASPPVCAQEVLLLPPVDNLQPLAGELSETSPLLSQGETEQTSREEAVAIDRLDIPDIDSLSLDLLARGLRLPWSIAFLPNGQMLIVEKHNGVRLVNGSQTEITMVGGVPKDVLQRSDSGYLDLILDPDFFSNRLIYLSFVEGDERSNRTAIWKARFDGQEFVDGQVIFRVSTSKEGPSHPGGRMVFLSDKTLLLSVGDGFDYAEAAQDMQSHLGKILRLNRDGKAPADNPFVGHPNVAAEIYTSGHRNVQGLAIDPESQTVWSHEHGPRGGDEMNEIVSGANYGWPTVTHGIGYDGNLISDRTHDAQFTRSHFIWSPSIAPSGLTLYRGEIYPELQDRFLVGGLAARSLIRLRKGTQTGLLIEEARSFAGLRERIRDVRTGPDGLIYLLTDSEEGQLLRIVPPTELAQDDGQNVNASQTPDKRALQTELGFLIGTWEGEAVHYYPREPDRAERREKTRAECAYILQQAYIQCDTVWTRGSGEQRRLRLHFNSLDDAYQVLFIYDNWPRHVSYPLTYDHDQGLLRGNSTFEDSEGAPGLERVEWQISEDKREINASEYNHLATDPDDYWAHYFTFVWRKID